MAAKNKGLGRGLDSIFFENDTTSPDQNTNKLRLTEMQPRSDQPRKNFDQEALQALADSIAANGVLQPILVRPGAMGMYEIIAGERRWRAARMAGLTEVPVLIVESDDRKTAQYSLIENIQREDLDAIEEALAYRSLISEFGMTQEAVAETVGKSRVAVTNALRLLDLPETVRKMIVDGLLSAGHARALLGLNNKDEIPDAAVIVAKEELSVRATEEYVRRRNSYKPRAAVEVSQDPKNVDYAKLLEKKIEKSLGRHVKIVDGKRSKKLELEYADNDDLEKLLVRLCGEGFFSETV